eukprot:4785773-Prymnesium_polylepis.1
MQLTEEDFQANIQAALMDPHKFIEDLLQDLGHGVKKLAIAKLKVELEPRLIKLGIAWDDVASELKKIDVSNVMEGIKNAMSSPEELESTLTNLIEELAGKAGPVARRLAIAKLKDALEDTLMQRGVAWHDVLPLLESITLDDIKNAITSSPDELLEKLAETAEP